MQCDSAQPGIAEVYDSLWLHYKAQVCLRRLNHFYRSGFCKHQIVPHGDNCFILIQKLYSLAELSLSVLRIYFAFAAVLYLQYSFLQHLVPEPGCSRFIVQDTILQPRKPQHTLLEHRLHIPLGTAVGACLTAIEDLYCSRHFGYLWIWIVTALNNRRTVITHQHELSLLHRRHAIYSP
mgnify:FL=1